MLSPRFFKSKKYEIGSKKVDEDDYNGQLKFNIKKFTNKILPTNPSDIVIFVAFSEFGSEFIPIYYTIPELLNTQYVGKYVVVVGWWGRSFLYQHLADEFWELDESLVHLRHRARAFHSESKALQNFEKQLSSFGKVVGAKEFAIHATCPIMDRCLSCNAPVLMRSKFQECVKCGRGYSLPGLYSNIKSSFKKALWLPKISEEKIEFAKKIVLPNSIGLTARGRKCYDRNLSPEFYSKLVESLNQLGYSIVWFAEKGTTQPTPNGVLDWSKFPESSDLEMTLAMVSLMKMTIQFWTASTRLAGAVGVPFIIFEDPDQISGNGQEGYRLELCSKGKYKLVLSHFAKAITDLEQLSKDCIKAIGEVEDNNFSTMQGLMD